MSRIRSIHPGFFKDDQIVPCSPFARLLILGLGVEADDKGTFPWKPVTIKMNVFPGDNVDIDALLAELIEADAICIYEIDGRKYGAIRNFRQYQRPKTPNDIHPITPEVADYVRLPRPISETDQLKQGQFPPKGEKSIQMEDGGGRRLKKAPQPPRRGDADDVLKNGLWEGYPTGVHDIPSEAQGAFDRIPEQDRPAAIAGAEAYGRQVRAETDARKTQRQPPPRIKKCARWLRDRGWEAMAKPVVSQERIDRNAESELFAACEQLIGKPAPPTVDAWSFPREIIEQAKKQTQAA